MQVGVPKFKYRFLKDAILQSIAYQLCNIMAISFEHVWVIDYSKFADTLLLSWVTKLTTIL
jgi:hypothetical protein